MKATDFKCLPQVALVLGQPEAEIQLASVLKMQQPTQHNLDHVLLGAFIWSQTPQGFDFWSDVNKASDGRITVAQFHSKWDQSLLNA